MSSVHGSAPLGGADCPSFALHNEHSSPAPVATGTPRYHRLAEARKSQGISLANVARRLGISVRVAQRKEDGQTDLRLSELYQWQEVLGLPIGELLIEPDEALAAPILERARMVRLMKTAKAISEQAGRTNVRLLAERLVQQLLEAMPELEQITAWPSVGQEHQAKELGVAASRRFPSDVSRQVDH